VGLGVSGLAFFLASYQVHEKSVLLPGLPLAALHPRLPLLSCWAALLTTWSMWPLLAKDGLVAPALLLAAGFAAVAWPTRADVEAGDAAWVEAALLHRVSRATCARALRWFVWGSLAGMAALGLAAAVVPPPPRLPDLHPYASAVYGAALLTALWGVLSAGLVVSGVAARGAGGVRARQKVD
jgi:alpha-1,3-glucosyltransferase